MSNLNVLIGVILSVLIASGSAVCPEKCRCFRTDQFDNVIDCSNAKLIKVPIFTDLNVKFLNLSNNYIREITDLDFANVTELKWLDLSNNRLDGKKISNVSFANNYDLEWL